MAAQNWRARPHEEGGLARYGDHVNLLVKIVDHRVHTGRIVHVDLGSDPTELENLAASLVRQARDLRTAQAITARKRSEATANG